MALAKTLSLLILFVGIIGLAAVAQAANFNITNNCTYTVWAAAVPGGGARLNPGEWWNISMANGTSNGRIWGRTNCSFDGAGRGKCLTGDCDGVLECNKTGTPPNTVVELALNQYNNLDFYDISVVEGFNVPLKLRPSYNCSSVECGDGDIIGECPRQLQVPGGCNNPCTVFNTTEYCCSSGVSGCGPTDYSKFFKERCPDAYSYPMDDATSTFTCKGGSDYTLLFCP